MKNIDRSNTYLNTIDVQRIQHYLLYVCTSSTGALQILDEIILWWNRAFQGLIWSNQGVDRWVNKNALKNSAGLVQNAFTVKV